MHPSVEITLTGHIQRITFQNVRSQFTIARFITSEQERIITILGNMMEFKAGDRLMIRGTWEVHDTYGIQLRVSHVEPLIPCKNEEMVEYLRSGFIKGLRLASAEKMVEVFGKDLSFIIENDPERLLSIRGIGEKTAKHIHESWKARHLVRNLIRFLQERGLESRYSAKLIRHYGTDALHVLEVSPCQVSQDLPEIGFLILDAIHRYSGKDLHSEERARACIIYLLSTMSEKGDMFMWDYELNRKCEEIFHIDIAAVESSLADLSGRDEVVIEPIGADTDGRAVFLKRCYDAEIQIAKYFQAIQTLPEEVFDAGGLLWLDESAREMNICLSDTQRNILVRLMQHRLAVLTGGPGTGKTTLIQFMANIMRLRREDLILAAPTGRAAQRISEITGMKAFTIHRLLGYQPDENVFVKCRENRISCDVVIVDEASMLDAPLLCYLLQALPVTVRVILIGDVCQLPSVGPGNILADIIESRTVPCYELTEIFRQNHESSIIRNAHMIRCGELPHLNPISGIERDSLSDFSFVEESDSVAISDKIMDLCLNEIPKNLRLSPVSDVQVITPMHKGPLGTISLNQRLQETLNPGQRSINFFGNLFRLNDKVMQTKNNYQKEVFNGEIGLVTSIDQRNETIQVKYEDREILYNIMDIDEISLAYAITVHKSQGSEYPIIILPLTTQHYILLQRNLLYTAVTRARNKVILIGSRKALNIALQNNRTGRRKTALLHRLTG